MNHTETDTSCKDHFPEEWEQDAFVTRREFTKSLGLASVAAFAGSLVLGALNVMRRDARTKHPVLKVTDASSLEVGASLQFQYPDEKTPCVLVHYSEDRYVAYAQKCTHLGCPVHYDANTSEFLCPCHVGKFSVEDGSPVAGPPRRALPSIEITQKGGEIWTTGTITV